MLKGHNAGMVRFLVALLTFAAGLSHAQTFGPELPVSAPTTVEVRASASGAKVATDGQDYLALWTDRRDGGSGVYGARFTAEGAVLDTDALRFGAGRAGDVVWTGDAYLVAWSNPEATEIRVALVGSDGTVGAARRVLTLSRVRPLQSVALATNGSTVLVVTDIIHAALLALDGPVLQDVPISVGGCAGSGVGAASSGDGYVVACGRDQGGLRIVVIRADGSTADSCCVYAGPVPVISSADAASYGTTYLVPYTDRNLHAKRLSASGQPFGGSDTTVDESPTAPAHSARAAARGSEYLVTYKRGFDLFAMRTDSTGVPIGSPMRFGESAGEQAAETASRADGSGAIVWPAAQGTIRAGLFDPVSIAAGAPFHRQMTISLENVWQLDPVVSAAGDAMVVAWREPSGDGDSLYIAGVGGERILLDRIDRGLTDYAVAFDGRHVWAFWSSAPGRGIRARRFSTDMRPLDAEPFFVAGTASPFTSFQAVEGAGAVMLVWRDVTGDAAATIVRSTDAGAVARRVQPLPVASEATTLGAWNGTDFVLVWRVSDSKLDAVRVDATGSIVGSSFTALSGIPIDDFILGSGSRFATLAWTNFGGTFALRLDGSTPSRTYAIPRPALSGELTEIVPLANGDSYFVWSRPGRIDLQRVTFDLFPIGPPSTFTSNALPPGSPDEPLRWFSLDAAGNSLVIAYMRAETRAGASPRVYVRREPVRRRAVR